MKNYLCLVTMLLLLGLSSCEQDGELKYSCDPQEDAWARNNLEEIRIMTRADWLKVDDSKKRVVYRAFSTEQKQIFWMEKIDKILLANQWEGDEVNHLLLLKEAVKNHLYWFNPEGIEADERTFDEFKIFAYQWLEYARDELKWDEYLIGAIVATGNDLEFVNGNVVNNGGYPKKVMLKNRAEAICDCKSSNIVFTTCGSLQNSDCLTNRDCEEIRDCGFLTSETCDGICVFGG